MEIFVSIVFILSALMVGVVSPGPSFVLIARIAMANSRNEGIAASIGMGVGAVIFSILALQGLHVALTNIPTLYFVLKILGGLCLLYLAICIWNGSNDSLAFVNETNGEQSNYKKSFVIGLVTQISNPKTAVVYASVFAALLPVNIPNSLYYILPPLIFVVEAGWYSIVALVLSTSSPRAAYLRSKSLIDRVASSVMAGLSVKLFFSANN